MRKKPGTRRTASTKTIKDIRRATASNIQPRRRSASCWMVCAVKRRRAGDTARAASTGEVKNLRREAHDLNEVVAGQALELRLLKKSMFGPLGDVNITCR